MRFGTLVVVLAGMLTWGTPVRADDHGAAQKVEVEFLGISLRAPGEYLPPLDFSVEPDEALDLTQLERRGLLQEAYRTTLVTANGQTAEVRTTIWIRPATRAVEACDRCNTPCQCCNGSQIDAVQVRGVDDSTPVKFPDNGVQIVATPTIQPDGRVLIDFRYKKLKADWTMMNRKGEPWIAANETQTSMIYKPGCYQMTGGGERCSRSPGDFESHQEILYVKVRVLETTGEEPPEDSPATEQAATQPAVAPRRLEAARPAPAVTSVKHARRGRLLPRVVRRG